MTENPNLALEVGTPIIWCKKQYFERNVWLVIAILEMQHWPPNLIFVISASSHMVLITLEVLNFVYVLNLLLSCNFLTWYMFFLKNSWVDLFEWMAQMMWIIGWKKTVCTACYKEVWIEALKVMLAQLCFTFSNILDSGLQLFFVFSTAYSRYCLKKHPNNTVPCCQIDTNFFSVVKGSSDYLTKL